MTGDSIMKAPEVSIMETGDPFEEFPQKMENIDAILAIERSLFLSLPAEVLQHILFNMDPATYFTCLLSCKTVFEAAKSRRVVLHHLNRLLGLRLGLEHLDSLNLFESFRKRAAKSMVAAGVLADITRYAPSDDLTNISRTVISPGKPTLMATAHDHGEVNIYELGKKVVRFKAELRTETYFDEDLQVDYHMEIIKLAFSPDKDLVVLCRMRTSKEIPSPIADEGDCEVTIVGTRCFKLVTFHRCHAKTKGYFYSSDQQETRDICHPSHVEPVGLALASNGTACITWQSPRSDAQTDLCLYARDSPQMEAQSYDPSPRKLILTDPPPRNNEAIRNRVIYTPIFANSDKVLNLHSPGHPIHKWYTYGTSALAEHCSPIHDNKEWLDIDAEDILIGYSTGIPFHGVHSASITVDYTEAPRCRTSYLAIAVQREDDFDGPCDNAFIVQSDHDHSPATCSHTTDLDAGRRTSSWRTLAFLAGYRQGPSSLGTIIAISPSGTHIAAATWSTILIWSFDPNLLLQGGLEHYFPTVDYNARKELGRLRPVRLKPEGVVHSLCWVGETALYAITDRGVVRWECGHLAEGTRQELTLQYDAWPETAIAMPLGGSRRGGRR